MSSRFIPWTGIWTVVVVSAVIGRIIDGGEPETEIIDENPSLTREQSIEWTLEFFRSVSPIGSSSHLEKLSGDQDGKKREDREFETFPSSRRSSAELENLRHYSESKTDFGLLARDGVPRPQIKTDNLEWMLKNIFTYPRSHTTNETAKNVVKKYISDSFQYTSGLQTTIQQFEPQQFLSIYEGELPIGSNIIAVIKGRTWSTPDDRPLVVGAHWDTVNFTPGTDDNGSGVAAMLETARALAHSHCTPKYSIIFVALDLEETGSQGSLVFIKEYLISILNSAGIPKLTNLADFQGAFIMDTIMNFNDTAESQTFPTDWSLVLPEVYDEVANEDYRGDFISVIYRKTVDYRLAEKFKFYWANLEPAHNSRFKLKTFPLELPADMPEVEILSDYLNFLRSDHARFWYMNDTEVPTTLRAVLITDTGPYRGNMRNCYHTVCDGPEVSVYNHAPNLQFLAKATQALTDTLVDLSQCDIGNKNQDGVTHKDNYIDLLSRRRGVERSSGMRSNSVFANLVKIVKSIQLS